MNEKKDNIYIYLWENLNTVYVGRTVNPKGRHYQHKHRETERTYQFSAEHGVEHPKMIIIENGLTIDEGVEHEKYWIKKYRDDMRYNVLNKTRGGQIGGQLNQSEEDKKKKRRAYNKEHRKLTNYDKIYYKNHRDEILKKRKLYRELHKNNLVF